MFTPIQVILLCVLVGVWTWQKYNLQMFYYASVVTMGVLTGLIMGDVRTGMLVGGAMCLMSLGLFGAGGSSVPEYPVECIAGAAFAIAMGITGQEAVTTAMTIGVPVAALGAQLDVLGKTSGSFFINKMRECSEKKNWKSMGRWMWASQIPFIGLWVLPILLFTTVGSTYVQSVINAIPAWLNSGLNVASGMLPALGLDIIAGKSHAHGAVAAAYIGVHKGLGHSGDVIQRDAQVARPRGWPRSGGSPTGWWWRR